MRQFEHRGFTLVEIMIVVAIIGILVSIATPGFIKAREQAQSKACMESQWKMEGAVDTWAIDTGKQTGDPADGTEIVGFSKYVKTWPVCPVADTDKSVPTHIVMPAVGSPALCPHTIVSHER